MNIQRRVAVEIVIVFLQHKNTYCIIDKDAIYREKVVKVNMASRKESLKII